MKMAICPGCEGTGLMKDVDETSVHYHPCRCCDGVGTFPESEVLERVKDMKTWPDSIRREHGIAMTASEPARITDPS